MRDDAWLQSELQDHRQRKYVAGRKDRVARRSRALIRAVRIVERAEPPPRVTNIRLAELAGLTPHQVKTALREDPGLRALIGAVNKRRNKRMLKWTARQMQLANIPVVPGDYWAKRAKLALSQHLRCVMNEVLVELAEEHRRARPTAKHSRQHARTR
jgi:hypothetical protein